jgi:hypothetical protein
VTRRARHRLGRAVAALRGAALAVALVLVATWAVIARAEPPSMTAGPSEPHLTPLPPDHRPGARILPPAPLGDLPLPIEIVHGRVTVHAVDGTERIAQQLAERADLALAQIADDLQGLPVPSRVELRLVRDARDLAHAAPPGRGAPTWAAGVAYPDLGVVVVALARDGNALDPIATASHEMAHLALGAALTGDRPADDDHVPRWLHEGFAWQHSTDADDGRATTLFGMAWFGSVIPLAELDTGFPAEELPAGRAYAESYDFVEFLSERGRWDDGSDKGDRDPFRRLLRYLAHGDTIDRAAIRAYGRPMAALFEEWRGDLKQRYMWLPVELFGLLLWLVAAVLLVLAWRRRRRQSRRTYAEWERQEAAARAARVGPPPFVRWPGQPDPLADAPHDPDDAGEAEPDGPVDRDDDTPPRPLN